jgi:hypothetical protein
MPQHRWQIGYEFLSISSTPKISLFESGFQRGKCLLSLTELRPKSKSANYSVTGRVKPRSTHPFGMTDVEFFKNCFALFPYGLPSDHAIVQPTHSSETTAHPMRFRVIRSASSKIPDPWKHTDLWSAKYFIGGLFAIIKSNTGAFTVLVRPRLGLGTRQRILLPV